MIIMVIYIMHIGKGRPLLKALHDHVVMKVADRWKDLGVQLLQSDQQHMLNIIATDHPNDAVECCKCVLEKWLETAPDATWNQLIEALRSPGIHLIYLANQLEQMVHQCKIRVINVAFHLRIHNAFIYLGDTSMSCLQSKQQTNSVNSILLLIYWHTLNSKYLIFNHASGF